MTVTEGPRCGRDHMTRSFRSRSCQRCHAFLDYDLAQLNKKADEFLKEKQAKKTSWSPEKYLDELHSIDFHKPDTIWNFYIETQDIVLSYRPLPILLGQDNDYWYYLISEDCADPPRDQKDRRDEKVAKEIAEFKPLPRMAARVSSARPTERELRFGFVLGSFNAIRKAPGGKRIRTLFVVVYNPVDSTVWLVFDPFDDEEFGEDGRQGTFIEERVKKSAGGWGGDFEGGFVGFDFGHYVAGSHAIAGALGPACHDALFHGVAEFRHFDGDGQ